VIAIIPGLEQPAGFVLFINDGVLNELEGFTIDEPWPGATDRFSIDDIKRPRNLAMLGGG